MTYERMEKKKIMINANLDPLENSHKEELLKSIALDERDEKKTYNNKL